MRLFLKYLTILVLTAGWAHAQSQATEQTGKSAETGGAQAAGSAPDLGYIPQAGSAPDSEANADSADPVTPWLPAPMNGEAPTAALLGELERSNELSGGVTVTGGYDDNALEENGRPVDNATVSFMPTLSITQSRPRTLLDFSYFPGFTVSQASQLNTSTEAGRLNFQYRITKYWTLRAHDTFSSTNDPYGTVAEGNNSVPGSVLHQPSDSVLTPFVNRISNTAGLDLVYQLGAVSMVGGSGTSDLLTYNNVDGGPGVQLIDSRSEGGEFFYTRRLFPKQWIGLTYSYQRFTFSGGVEESDAHTALLFYTISIQRHLTLSLYGGAAYAMTDGEIAVLRSVTIPASSNQWLPNEGFTLEWQGLHTGMSASFSRGLSGGGGLFGTADRYNGACTVHHQFRPHWSANAGFSYDNDRPINLASGPEFRTVAGNVGLEHQLGEHLDFGATYSRVHQIYAGLTAAELFPDHNRAFLSVSYLFHRPLGR